MLIETSAWIEYLQRTGSAHHLAVRAAIADDDAHTTDTVRLELICGATSAHLAHDIARMLDACTELRQLPTTDVDTAGEIYRMCRLHGETVRRPNDCLIAAVAIRHDVPVLHRDADFDAIARHTTLRVVTP